MFEFQAIRKGNRDLALGIVRNGHCFTDGSLDTFGTDYTHACVNTHEISSCFLYFNMSTGFDNLFDIIYGCLNNASNEKMAGRTARHEFILEKVRACVNIPCTAL